MENSKIAKFDRILTAAIKIIGQKGFHNAKIKDIATMADVADGTIYNYFKNKEDLLVTIFKIKLDEYVSQAKEELKGIQDPRDKFRKVIEYHFRVMSEDPDLANVLQVELRQPDKDMRIKVRKSLKNYFKVVEEVILEGVAQGIFRQGLNIYLAREIYFGTLDEIVSTWVFTGQSWDLMVHVDELKEMLTKALS